MSAVDRNFRVAYSAMTAENGWDQVRSRAHIASERPGPPEPDGPFEKAWTALVRYEFSDPRVVVGHFDPTTPLEGRRILLELKVLGLRYLCPVRISQVRWGSESEPTVRGYRIDTLEGHMESGSEWFLLEKDPVTGRVDFQIEAAWRLGSFPNLWSWVGFLLLARRYQRAWHRLTHLRMRDLASRATVPSNPVHGGLEHDELRLPVPRVHDVARSTRWQKHARKIEGVEEEQVAQRGLAGAHKR